MQTKKVDNRLSIAQLDIEAYRYLIHDSFDLLNLVGGEWPNLEPLIPYKHKIRKLQTITLIESFVGLDQLTELIELNLCDDTPDPIYDFAPLSKLQKCKLAWSRKIKGQSFFTLPELRKLSIYLYKAPDCFEIGLSKTLRELWLRYGRVDSLKGLKGCLSLEDLRLTSVRGLSSLEGLEECRTLKRLQIDLGSLEGDVDEGLRRLSSLEEVTLHSKKMGLAGIDWLACNPRMRKLVLGCTVRHIDWNILFSAPHLEDVLISHLPKMLPPDDEIKAIARRHGKEILDFEHCGTRGSPFLRFRVHRSSSSPSTSSVGRVVPMR